MVNKRLSTRKDRFLSQITTNRVRTSHTFTTESFYYFQKKSLDVIKVVFCLFQLFHKVSDLLLLIWDIVVRKKLIYDGYY